MEVRKKLNLDTLYEIVNFLEPCPILYSRLAMVNREFSEMFTSDVIWKKFDVYDKRTGIYQHFRESIRGYEGLMRLLCQGNAGNNCPIPDIEGQKYFRFFNDLRTGVISNDTYSTRELWLLLRVNPSTFARFLDELVDNRELALYACQNDVRNFNEVSLRLSRDEGFVKACLQWYVNQPDEICPMGNIRILRDIVGPRLEKWLWEVSPALYLRVWFYRQPKQLLRVGRIPIPIITDRQTALAALKGNAQYLNHFPEYSNDLDVVLASLSPPVICDAIYGILRNHGNDEFVTAVLSEHPYLLYAAPDRFRQTKEAFHRFLDSLEYVKTIKFNIGTHHIPELLDWAPESFWKDAEIAGRAADIFGNDLCEIMQSANVFHLLKSHFSCFEWAKKRVEYRPSMFAYALGRWKYTRLLGLANESLRSFGDAPGLMKARNCLLYRLDPMAQLCKDYPKLEELARNNCTLNYWDPRNNTLEVIKANLTNNLLQSIRTLRVNVAFASFVATEEIERARLELLHEYVQNPINLAYLQTLKFTLHWLWDNAVTSDFALTFLGPRPPELRVEEFAKLDGGFFYPAPKPLLEYYSMPVEDAVRLVSWNAHLYSCLSDELRRDQEVQRAIGRLRKYVCGHYTCSYYSCYHHIPAIRLKAADS